MLRHALQEWHWQNDLFVISITHPLYLTLPLGFYGQGGLFIEENVLRFYVAFHDKYFIPKSYDGQNGLTNDLATALMNKSKI